MICPSRLGQSRLYLGSPSSQPGSGDERQPRENQDNFSQSPQRRRRKSTHTKCQATRQNKLPDASRSPRSPALVVHPPPLMARIQVADKGMAWYRPTRPQPRARPLFRPAQMLGSPSPASGTGFHLDKLVAPMRSPQRASICPYRP